MISTAHLAEDTIALMGEAPSLARCRSIASRAYYAAYHACLEAATNAGYRREPDGRGTHEQLHGFMRSGTTQALRRAGERLRRLYRYRIDADYNLHVPVLKEHADEALEDMTEIREILGID